MGKNSGFATNYFAKRLVNGACGGTTGNIACTTQTLTATPSNYVNSIIAQYNNNTNMYSYYLSIVTGLPTSGTVVVVVTDAYQNTYTWNNAIISNNNIVLTSSPDSVNSYGPGPAQIINSSNNSFYDGSYKFYIQNYSTTNSTFSFGVASNGSQSITFVANY
jgi:hypothetical protein